MGKKLKVLNLYAGIGGNRKLWEDVEVTAIEIDKEIANIYQGNFPQDKMVIGDARQYLLDHYKEFGFIWGSPECPKNSRARFWAHGQSLPTYPDFTLYEMVVFLKHYFKGLYCIENVKPYYGPLMNPKEIGRHLVWANFTIGNIEIKSADVLTCLVNGFKYTGPQRKDKILRNQVEPEIGLYILNCARNIITKQNIKQTELFA